MGPAVTAGADILNEAFFLYLAIGAAISLAAVAVSFASDGVATVARRREVAISHADPCVAFSDAVARGDLVAAEAFAETAFARRREAVTRGGEVRSQ